MTVDRTLVEQLFTSIEDKAISTASLQICGQEV